MDLEKEIEKELGKQGAKGSSNEDWAEIQADIDGGLSRAEAIQKYLNELEESKKQEEIRFQTRKQEYLNSEEYKLSQLTPEEFKNTEGKKRYNDLIIKWKSERKGAKVRDYDSFMDLTGFCGHDMICFNAYILYDIPIPQECIIKYKLNQYKYK